MAPLYLINHTRREFAYIGEAEGDDVSVIFRDARWSVHQNVTLNMMDRSDRENFLRRGYIDIDEPESDYSDEEYESYSPNAFASPSSSMSDLSDTFTSYDVDTDDVRTLYDPSSE